MSMRFGTLALALAMSAPSIALAHKDDPKIYDRVPRYEGPGFRADLADPAADAAAESGGFPSENVQLTAWLPLGEFGGFSAANDCWGYVSPSGREYAIIGLSSATGFVEVTNPGNPQIIDTIAAPSSSWRDIKVYGSYAYAVTEGSGAGIQVIDLSAIDAGTVSLANTTAGTGSTHNVAIDTDSGFLYRTGGGSNGLRIYDLNANPVSPPQVGSWSVRYVHDAQIVTYDSGPYAGRQIAFCCSGFNGGSVETGLDILDVTDKGNIIELSRIVYANGAYSHQAWLSEDRQLLYLNDELDENGSTVTTKTFVFDVSDLDNPFQASTFTNGNTAIGHNLYTHNGLLFEANYRSGLRVFELSHPLNPTEIGYFDTWPQDDNANFNGLWSCFPYFPSGTVIGSDIEKGLFVWQVGTPLIAFDFPDGVPALVAPDGDSISVRITEETPGDLVPGTARIFYREADDAFVGLALTPMGGDLYEATMPAAACETNVEFYFQAEDTGGFTIVSPLTAPSAGYAAIAADAEVIAFSDDGQTNPGYTVENVALDDGGWDRGVPAGGGDRGDPANDYDGSGACWLTDNEDGNSDVDGGPTRLTTPAIDLTGTVDPLVSYARWFTNDDDDIDRLTVEVSANGGAWQLIESVPGTPGWTKTGFRAFDVVPGATSIRLRFSATDNPNDSVTEAGIDAVRVSEFQCVVPDPCPADTDETGEVGFSDLLAVLAAWGPCVSCPQDVDDDGVVGFADLLIVLAAWGPCD